MVKERLKERGPYAVKKAFKTLLFGILGFHVLALWLVIKGDTLQKFIDGNQAPASLVLVSLEFEGGYFIQDIKTSTGEAVPARWSAIIREGNRFVCGGGGVGTYRTRLEPSELSPDDWAGDECTLIPGREYIAEAAWEWLGSDGQPERLSRIFSFVYTAPKTGKDKV